MALRLVFMGTPAFSVPCLKQIVAAGHDVTAVYTQPSRPAGRGMEARPTPVHIAAKALKLHIETPSTLRTQEAQDRVLAWDADAAVIVAYGLLLPPAIIHGPKLGCYNLHASKLPRWRGAAPIQRAIMSGDRHTAATIMKMDEGLDTGPVCLEHSIEITGDMTAGDLHDHLAICGGDLMVKALNALEAGTLPERPQSQDGVTYARKLEKSESRIDFNRDAGDVHNLIRALSPFPGAWFEIPTGDGKVDRVKVLKSELVEGNAAPGTVIGDAFTVACRTGAIRLLSVQRAGRKVASAEEFLRGFDLPQGTVLPS